MQKVITIDLNGRAFQLDEDAYDALRGYLDKARRSLAQNPDLAEIMADLEQAIGEKCQKFINAHKTVIAAEEVRRVIKEMGPVDEPPSPEPSGPANTDREPPTGDGNSPRRLYQIRQGAWISGVCTGIAAYFDVDVMFVRIAFVILAVVTKGPVGVMIYLFLMFALPHANTSEEHAAAHGVPFNAREIIDHAASNAKRAFDQAFHHAPPFGGSSTDRRAWRREWRQARREWRAAWRGTAWWAPPRPAAPVHVPYGSQVAAGVMMPLFALVGAGLFWLWLAAIMSLLSTGALFGRSLPDGLPLWAALLIVILLYNAVSWPLQMARCAAYQTIGGTNFMNVGAWDGMMSLGFSLLAFWFAYQYVPEVHNFLGNLPAVRDNFRQIFQPR